jgi:8-oxo-dGTP pyrophosphatase MutT (NUDIX family)
LFVEQAGAVVYRRDGAALRILLVRARKNAAEWIFPKGHIEEDESPADAAVREAEEEAGVTGHVVAALFPALTFSQGERTVRVQYFLVEFSGEVKSKERREHIWLPPPEALVRLSHSSSQSLLEGALEKVRPA